MQINSLNSIRKGSKSFFLASLFFDAPTKKACWDLYQWCRYCDDQIDATESDAAKNLMRLWSEWHNPHPTHPSFVLVRSLALRYEIPDLYFLDLLKGFAMDVDAPIFGDMRALETYAYHVAGTVGIKMSYIMGLSDAKALRHAMDLGIAMQFTNMARDVKEDFIRGRIYLPANQLQKKGLDKTNLMQLSQRPLLYEVVLDLLDRADDYYRSGYQGLRYLPWRGALAVSIAGSIYSRIGKKIRRQGLQALDQRTVVSLPEKWLCVVEGSCRVMPILIKRLRQPWKPVKLPPLETEVDLDTEEVS